MTAAGEAAPDDGGSNEAGPFPAEIGALAAFIAGRPQDGRLTPPADPALAPGPPARLTRRAEMFGRADAAAGLTATKLMGEPVSPLGAAAGGFRLIRSLRDGYVGHVADPAGDLLGPLAPPAGAAWRRVAAGRARIHSAPDEKARVRPGAVFLEERVAAAAPARRERGFLQLADGGWIAERALAAETAAPRDWVAAAEGLIGAPYVWGGDTPEGLDCSGLVKLAMWAADRVCPRDSDMQAAFFARAVPDGAPLWRGDLVFWKGHVGVMVDALALLHANAWAMAAAVEPLSAARARIAASGGGDVTAIRRP